MTLETVRLGNIPPKKKLRVGDIWGGWTLCEHHCIEFRNEETEYWIPLDSIRDGAGMLDWIFQLHNKNWATNDIIGDLVSAFEDIFEPQARLCSFGQNHSIHTKEFLKDVIEE